MKIIICGAGQVGWQIARHLSGERGKRHARIARIDMQRHRQVYGRERRVLHGVLHDRQGRGDLVVGQRVAHGERAGIGGDDVGPVRVGGACEGQT